MREHINIQTRYRTELIPGDPAAVYCPTSDPASWLHTLDQLDMDPLSVRVAVITHPINSETPIGALLFHPKETIAGILTSAFKFYQPLPGFWIPERARLDPLPLESELADWPAFDWYIWTHDSGWIGFHERDLLRASDLYQIPECAADRTWTLAKPIPSPTHLIENVELSIDGEQSSMGILESLSDKAPLEDLGAGEILNDPAWKQAFKNWGSQFIQKTLGKKNKASTNNQPGALESSPRNWKSKLTNWAQKTQDQLEYQRMNELGRLVQLFEKDPREALKYAPSLARLNRGRGEPPAPTNKLTRRDPTWNSERYQQSGPIDAWDIPNEISWRLRTEYRRSAEQAIREGRFDEAAYIYAELLGDLHSAANVLKQGGRFQEAAYIYETMLNYPELAAGCLQEGGYLTGAAKSFERCSMWERAGDVYRDAGEWESAKRCYQLAVEKESDATLQAQILDEKLQDWESACDRLKEDFPKGLRPKSSQASYWKILARESQWSRLQDSIHQLFNSGSRIHPVSTQLENLIDLYQIIQDSTTRELIRTTGAFLSAECLNQRSGQAEIRKTLNRLGALFPEDPGVTLDAQRFLKFRDRAEKRHLTDPDSKIDADTFCRVTKSIQLPEKRHWTNLFSNGSVLLLLAFSNQENAWIHFHTLDVLDPISQVSGPFEIQVSDASNLNLVSITQHIMGIRHCSPKTYPFHVNHRPMTLECPEGWNDRQQVLTDSDDGLQAQVVHSGDGWALNLHEWDGSLVRSLPLNLPGDFQPGCISTIRRKKRTSFFLGRDLYWIPDRSTPKVFSFDTPIQRLTPLTAMSTTMLAVMNQTHLILVRPNHPGKEIILDETLNLKVRDLSFTTDNWVILLTDKEIRCYQSTKKGLLKKIVPLNHSTGDPVAVRSAGAVSTIGLLYKSGLLEIRKLSQE